MDQRRKEAFPGFAEEFFRKADISEEKMAVIICAVSCALLSQETFLLETCSSAASLAVAVSGGQSEEMSVQKLLAVSEIAGMVYWYRLKNVKFSLRLACGHIAREHFEALSDLFFMRMPDDTNTRDA